MCETRKKNKTNNNNNKINCQFNCIPENMKSKIKKNQTLTIWNLLALQ